RCGEGGPTTPRRARTGSCLPAACRAAGHCACPWPSSPERSSLASGTVPCSDDGRKPRAACPGGDLGRARRVPVRRDSHGQGDDAIVSPRSAAMPRGDKDAYPDKQKRKARHIEEGYEARGVPEDKAERRAWATVNKESGGGNKSGSG